VIEFGQFLLQHRQQTIDAFEKAAADQLAPAVAFRGHHLDDLTPPGDQFTQGPGLLVWHRPGLGLDLGSKAGNDLGIERVGLGKLTGGAREVTDLPRIDYRQRNRS
jgi:hypothetical protein